MGPKKGAGTVSQNRRDSQRQIAESRAAHFARADPSDRIVSSTPTGSLRQPQNVAKAKESWPGPFSTALQIIADKDAAKKLRDEAIAAAGSCGVTDFDDQLEMDKYDTALANLSWKPTYSFGDSTAPTNVAGKGRKKSTVGDVNAESKKRNRGGEGPMKSLMDLCVTSLVKYFDAVDSFDFIPSDGRDKIAVELAKNRMLNEASALKIVSTNSQSVVLPECSTIGDRVLIQCVEKACGLVSSSEMTSQSIGTAAISTTELTLLAQNPLLSVGSKRSVAELLDDEDEKEEAAEAPKRGKKGAKTAKTVKTSKTVVVKVEEVEVVQQLVQADKHNEEEEDKAESSTSNRRSSRRVSNAQVAASAPKVGGKKTEKKLETKCEEEIEVEIEPASSSSVVSATTSAQSNHSHVVGLSDNSSSSTSSEVQQFKSLLFLNLRNCGLGLTDSTASRLLPYISSLQVLELQGLYKLNDTALSTLLSASGETLQSINLNFNSRLGAVGMTAMIGCRQLRSVVLDHCTHLVDADLMCLLPATHSTSSSSGGVGLPHLEELSFANLYEVTDDALCPLVMQYGSKLTSLCLSGCNKLTDNTLVAIRSVCCVLQKLDLSNLVEVTTTAAIGLFIVHPKLMNGAAANLNGQEERPNPFINPFYTGDAAVTTTEEEESEEESEAREETTGDKFTSLFANTLHNSLLGSSEATLSIGQLHYVNLSGTVTVTDDVVVHLVQNNSRSLTSLRLNGCHQCTAKSMVAIAMNCSQSLTTLDISFLRRITEDSVGFLIDSCLELQEISVWGCSSKLTSRLFDGHSKNDLRVIGRMTA